LFGVTSTSVWNAELLYSDDLAEALYQAGYKTLLTEGAKHILSWQSANYVYQSPVKGKQAVLLRNMGLSDALSFHFSDSTYAGYPMDAQKFVSNITALPEEEEIVNVWMGAETFGIRQVGETGIFDFLKAVPYFAIEQSVGFLTPSEAGKKLHSNHLISSPYPLTWAGEAKDLSTFTGNDLQQEALRQLYSVAERVRLCADVTLRRDWLLLQDVTYMSDMQYTSGGRNGFESPYDAFINYTNILSDFLQRVEEQYPTSIENEELTGLLKTIHNQELEIAELKRKRRTPKDQKKTV
jgi:alpha-amylase